MPSFRLALLSLTFALALGCAHGVTAPPEEPATTDAGTGTTPAPPTTPPPTTPTTPTTPSPDAGEPAPAGDFLRTDGALPQINAFYVGHSLVSDIPDIAMNVLNHQQAGTFTFKEQFIPGSPLRWHWDNAAPNGSHPYVPATSFNENVHVALASGDYSHVVITDSVPRGGQELVDETVTYLGHMVAAARAARPDVRVYYYETWHHLTSGTAQSSEYDTVSPTRHLPWRERLEADAAMWQSIVDRVNAAHPPGPDGHPVKLLPAGRILGRLADAVQAGAVPGFDEVKDLFADDIHTNSYAKYLIGMIHASVLTHRDPTVFTSEVGNRWGSPYWGTQHFDGNTYPAPSAAAVAEMKKVAKSGIHELYTP